MGKSNRKQRLSVYLDATTMKRLVEHAARRSLSRSLIAEAAIDSFLSPDAAERQEAATAKRLDQVDRRIARMERDVTISLETLAIFVRFWLATTPTLWKSLSPAFQRDLGMKLINRNQRAFGRFINLSIAQSMFRWRCGREATTSESGSTNCWINTDHLHIQLTLKGMVNILMAGARKESFI